MGILSPSPREEYFGSSRGQISSTDCYLLLNRLANRDVKALGFLARVLIDANDLGCGAIVSNLRLVQFAFQVSEFRLRKERIFTRCFELYFGLIEHGQFLSLLCF